MFLSLEKKCRNLFTWSCCFLNVGLAASLLPSTGLSCPEGTFSSFSAQSCCLQRQWGTKCQLIKWPSTFFKVLCCSRTWGRMSWHVYLVKKNGTRTDQCKHSGSTSALSYPVLLCSFFSMCKTGCTPSCLVLCVRSFWHRICNSWMPSYLVQIPFSFGILGDLMSVSDPEGTWCLVLRWMQPKRHKTKSCQNSSWDCSTIKSKPQHRYVRM